jgi:mono/diheme cytochrome c family protein
MKQLSKMIGVPALASALLGGPALGADPDLVTRGRKFSELVCSVCHVVSMNRNEVPILRDPGPSFPAIAARPSTTEAALRNYLATRHPAMGSAGRMPNPRLVDYQIDEVVAYILSLRGRPQ